MTLVLPLTQQWGMGLEGVLHPKESTDVVRYISDVQSSNGMSNWMF